MVCQRERLCLIAVPILGINVDNHPSKLEWRSTLYEDLAKPAADEQIGDTSRCSRWALSSWTIFILVCWSASSFAQALLFSCVQHSVDKSNLSEEVLSAKNWRKKVKFVLQLWMRGLHVALQLTNGTTPMTSPKVLLKDLLRTFFSRFTLQKLCIPTVLFPPFDISHYPSLK